MTLPSTMLDSAPNLGANAAGLLIGGAIFLVALAIAVIAFKILKKSLKMAFKVVLVVMLLIVLGLSAIGFFVYRFIEGQSSPSKSTPTLRQK